MALLSRFNLKSAPATLRHRPAPLQATPVSTQSDVTMTPLPTRRLLALALATAIAMPAWAQTTEPAPGMTASAGAFTATDIRIEGLQRISAGTVLTYLPIERGDTVDSAKVVESIRALYKTGFFEDVSLDRQGNILVITVAERPAINKLTLTGNKDIKTEDLMKGLQDIGLAEGETFDRLALDRVTQELVRQYNNRGKYNVEITPTVSPVTFTSEFLYCSPSVMPAVMNMSRLSGLIDTWVESRLKST